MLAAGGIHPYAIRRRQIALSRMKPLIGGVAPALLLAMVLIVGFAYGLRSVDRRFAPTDRPASPEVRPSDTETHHMTA